MRIAYLFSRYPVISQTFCDTEMLALERLGLALEVGSIYPPLTSLRHEHAACLRAPVYYAPPQSILRIWEEKARAEGRWPDALVAAHTERFGPAVKASQRARNALFFSDLFRRHDISHFHVHFANRAAHTALFVQELTGLPFSITAHGQDFMVDLQNDELLREICRAAEFVAAETEYSCGLLRERCPGSAGKIHRVYNGMNLDNFPCEAVSQWSDAPLVKIVSVGRLIEFKGFQHLIAACAGLRAQKLNFICEIVGEGPLRGVLEEQIATLNLGRHVILPGALSQQEIFAKLRECDIFSLPCVRDRAGASDVFPTVILEAMASARPVVSTQLAGVPESVLHGETGFLVSPSDVSALTESLATLIRDPGLRQKFGAAGRARVEGNFQVETTVLPLKRLFEHHSRENPARSSPPSPDFLTDRQRIAYLIDTWPDSRLPNLDLELKELQRREIPVKGLVCEVPSDFHAKSAMRELASEMDFLPDAMVLEAEWQQRRQIARLIENLRNGIARDVPSAIFLRQARFALGWRNQLSGGKFCHVHATSSRSLVCAFILRELLGLSISVTLEPESDLAQKALDRVLSVCAGGRVAVEKHAKRLGSSFLLDTWTSRKSSVVARAASRLTTLRRRDAFWLEWSGRLVQWSQCPPVSLTLPKL